MITEKEIKDAFSRILKREDGNLRQLSTRLNVPYTVIYNLEHDKTNFFRMTVGTLARLFPDMRAYYFREDYPKESTNNFQGAQLNGVQMGNANHIGVVNGHGNASETDDTTRILLDYWSDLPHSKRFEFLAKLAEIKEQ